MAGVIKLNLDVSSLDNPNALLVGEMEKVIEKISITCLVENKFFLFCWKIKI